MTFRPEKKCLKLFPGQPSVQQSGVTCTHGLYPTSFYHSHGLRNPCSVLGDSGDDSWGTAWGNESYGSPRPRSMYCCLEPHWTVQYSLFMCYVRTLRYWKIFICTCGAKQQQDSSRSISTDWVDLWCYWLALYKWYMLWIHVQKDRVLDLQVVCVPSCSMAVRQMLHSELKRHSTYIFGSIYAKSWDIAGMAAGYGDAGKTYIDG